MKAGVQATIDGLGSAASKAKHSNVRDAMNAAKDDYTKLLDGLNSGNVDPNLVDKATSDLDKIDSLCTVG